MKKAIKRQIIRLIEMKEQYSCYKQYSSQFKKYIIQSGFENKVYPGEDRYKEKWGRLCTRVEPYSYRFFSHFMGYSPNIVPEDIGRQYIEKLLNPLKYQFAFQDKNMFPIVLGKENVPKTVLCRINGGCLLNSEYKPLDDGISFDLQDVFENRVSLILKPSVDSGSGKGVMKFDRKDGAFVSEDNVVLSKDFLMSYNDDFCLQESIVQHDFMNMLCKSSVNTLRLCVYKSITNNVCEVTAAIVRVGKDGSVVDNAHAGGRFVGIDISNGKLGNCTYDQFGNKLSVWNGIDYSKESLILPHWNAIVKFAQMIGDKVIPHHLFALDIALQKDNTPILVEYNIGQGFSYWLFHYTGQEVFGKYTDEVIDYCSRIKNKTN